MEEAVFYSADNKSKQRFLRRASVLVESSCSSPKLSILPHSTSIQISDWVQSSGSEGFAHSEFWDIGEEMTQAMV